MTFRLAMTRPAIDVGRVVGDLATALRFYRDTLGLDVRREMRVEGVGTMVASQAAS